MLLEGERINKTYTKGKFKTNLICNIAQNIPEFLDIVVSSLHRDKNDPWAVQMIAAPTPSTALTE